MYTKQEMDAICGVLIDWGLGNVANELRRYNNTGNATGINNTLHFIPGVIREPMGKALRALRTPALELARAA